MAACWVGQASNSGALSRVSDLCVEFESIIASRIKRLEQPQNRLLSLRFDVMNRGARRERMMP